MPGMKGVDLLARARELVPHAERIIITGYTDPQDIIAAINEGHVYRYILKPWTEEDLQVTITQAVERHHLKQHNRELVDELNQKNQELEDRVRERTAELAMVNLSLVDKVEELERTQNELKTLQGFLSICCYCKKMKVTDDNWVSMDEYMSRHTDVQLSHGICPDCHPRVMKDLAVQAANILGKGGNSVTES